MATKVTKLADKLAKVNDNFSVNMYDNGFMIEVSGRDKKDDWKTAKLMVSSVDELVAVIKEYAAMDRVD